MSAIPHLVALLPLAALLGACGTQKRAERTNAEASAVIPDRPLVINAGRRVEDDPKEIRFRNLRQLTFAGENAEAYWSFDGTKLILQSRTNREAGDQIYTLDLASGALDLVSTGTARTTCSYFLQGDERVVYASTHGAGPQVPMVKRGPEGYVWGVFDTYDIWTADVDGSNLVQITDTPG